LIRLRVAHVMDGTRYAKVLLALLLLILGGAAILYGLFALMYGADGSSATYVTLAGHQLNATLAGATSVVLGILLVASGLLTQTSGPRSRYRGFREPTDEEMT
jgi:uncharacterized membrane protein YphA (DoxX/SURF4 family)